MQFVVDGKIYYYVGINEGIMVLRILCDSSAEIYWANAKKNIFPMIEQHDIPS